jgi:hypothetical protein
MALEVFVSAKLIMKPIEIPRAGAFGHLPVDINCGQLHGGATVGISPRVTGTRSCLHVKGASIALGGLAL